jgi:FAD/FMN-containing dehydrogenase
METAAAEELASQLSGQLIQPKDPDYESARAIWNGIIDRRPALIARCATEDDVALAVRFGAENDLRVAVRGGGHGVAGHAICDDGIVIDLSEMKAIEVDPDGRTVRAGGGCTLGDLDRETQRHGLATPLGVVTETGIAGLTLSGGIGWLRRKYGLSCDNLISARVATADGGVLAASETDHQDLFWALRGGGGNFGVVTSFEYSLYPVGPEVFVCFVFYPMARAGKVLQACERFLDEAPDEVSPLGVLGRVPEADEFPVESHGDPYVALLAPYPGDPDEGENALAPLRELGDPIGDLSGRMPYTEAQSVLDEDYPDGWRYYWKSVNLAGIGDAAIERLLECAAAAPSDESTIDVWFQGGAIADVGEHETAFANRREPYLLGIEANWQDDADSEENVAWVRRTVDVMSRFSEGGTYLNFPGFLEEGDRTVQEGYGTNYERLVQVKTKYDPNNLFRLNANIQPAA